MLETKARLDARKERAGALELLRTVGFVRLWTPHTGVVQVTTLAAYDAAVAPRRKVSRPAPAQ